MILASSGTLNVGIDDVSEMKEDPTDDSTSSTFNMLLRTIVHNKEPYVQASFASCHRLPFN